MVTIRLTRRGAKNQPFYHVVVTDSRKRQGGSSLEQVGYFNPVARGKDTRLKLDLDAHRSLAQARRAAVRPRAAAGACIAQATGKDADASQASPAASSRYLVLGRIVAPHGVRGWIEGVVLCRSAASAAAAPPLAPAPAARAASSSCAGAAGAVGWHGAARRAGRHSRSRRRPSAARLRDSDRARALPSTAGASTTVRICIGFTVRNTRGGGAGHGAVIPRGAGRMR